MQFPPGFLWGSATSAYQVEGAVREGGRGESIWDRFCREPGKVKDGDHGDVACDHYHRWEDDVALMADLGLSAYRFSIAWPRVLPEGSGRVNQAGLDYYRRLAEKLLARGIRPAATLYHWDLPQVLQDKGGWTNRETADRFAEFTSVTVRALGDLIPDWITHNEPWVVAFVGHTWGSHAPGIRGGWWTGLQVAHHVLLSHGMGVQAFRAAAPAGAKVGVVLNLGSTYAASDSPADVAAARRQDGFANRWFLDPVLRGAYPADMVSYYEEKFGPLSFVQPGDLATIAQPIDFLGINYYSSATVMAKPDGDYFELAFAPATRPVTALNWEVVPEGLFDLLVRIKREYGEIPLYITENGAAYNDVLGTDGKVADSERVAYLGQHFAAAARAIAAGVNLKGYYVWSLMDNFEWAEGYSKRFGIVYTDYPTLRRVPKESYYFYRDVIRRGGLDSGGVFP
ncbi:MAG TPA: GH1 family beta-glucosidase [Symbiobacteriaceae bacterium]